MILVSVVGCVRGSPGDSAPFCLVYEPVYTSDQDTELTRRQVDRNNTAWEALGC